MSSQVQLMKQFDLQLVWYGAGNAIFAHRLAAHLLGLLGSAIAVRRPNCSAISLPVRDCLSAGLPSPLDEVDCYAKSVLMTMWPSGRTLRRWFYEERRLAPVQFLMSVTCQIVNRTTSTTPSLKSGQP